MVKVLFTGASSFTGYWFVQELIKNGHEVTVALWKTRKEYQGLRRSRLEQLFSITKVIEKAPFGSDSFIHLLKEQSWDLLCHHAADVTDYKSPHFDPIVALQTNAFRMEEVLQYFKGTLILTGSIFEQGEGKSDEPLRAFSPYGLSKGMTSDLFEYYCWQSQIPLRKFVIPNPFGPFEEDRFTTFLIKQWFSEKIPEIKSPNYIRDNIPVTLLAKAYVYFIEKKIPKWNPSYRPENIYTFASKFAKEMEQRISIACPFTCSLSPIYTEPIVRTNFDPIPLVELDWKETKFWDELAEFYQKTYGVLH